MPAADDALIPRHAAKQVATALADTPVVLVNGPRQCGKTTLVRGFAVDGRRYVTDNHAASGPTFAGRAAWTASVCRRTRFSSVAA